jgi:hypothetical protein
MVDRLRLLAFETVIVVAIAAVTYKWVVAPLTEWLAGNIYY